MAATYKKSKAGIYDSDANFDNEEVGPVEDPDGFLGDHGSILSEFKTHAKVYYQYDTLGTGVVLQRNFAGNEEFGSVEFYIAVTDVTKRTEITLSEVGFFVAKLVVDNSKFRYVDNGGEADIGGAPTPVNNTWYHVRMSWEGTAGAYEGLAQDTWEVYINATQYGPYNHINAGKDVGVFAFNTDSVDAAHGQYFDAWGLAGTGGPYSLGDNLAIEADSSMTTSNIYGCVVKGTVMDYKRAKMVIDESEEIVKGTKIQITETYSVGGATASAVIFEGMVTTITSTNPTECLVESLAKEDLTNKPVAGTEAGRTDEIITAQTADINYVADGTHEAGTAMGTLSFGGTKSYKQIWTNLAKMDGSIWYLWRDAGTLKINFNDYDTDTGVDIDQDSNIVLLEAGRPARRYTKTYVLGLDGASGSASASAADLANYGTNTYPHVDRTLSAALCGTCATNLLAVLNQDNYLVRLKYSISGVGYVQEGQTITFAHAEEGSETIASAQFIVWECEWDTVGQEGVLTLLRYPHYEWVDSQLIQENAEQIDANVTYQTTQHTRRIFTLQVYPEQGWTVGVNNCYWTDNGLTHGSNSNTAGNYCGYKYRLPSDYVAGTDLVLIVHWRTAIASDVCDYKIDFYSSPGDVNFALRDSEDSTWTAPAVAWAINLETVTLDGSALVAGEFLTIQFYAENDTRANVIYSSAAMLDIQVNTRE